MDFLSLCKITKVTFTEEELPEVLRQFRHQMELADKLVEVDAETGFQMITPNENRYFSDLPQEQLRNCLLQNADFTLKLRKGE